MKGWKDPAIVLRREEIFVLIHPCHLMKATQQKSPTTPNVKPVKKDTRCVPGKVHKEKEYSSSDDTENDSDKEEENTPRRHKDVAKTS